jgi:hypothetical protein
MLKIKVLKRSHDETVIINIDIKFVWNSLWGMLSHQVIVLAIGIISSHCIQIFERWGRLNHVLMECMSPIF